MPSTPRILAFSGSARKESLNKKLLAAAAEAVRAAGGEVTLLDLNDVDLPLYHGDLEEAQGLPEGAKKLIGLVAAHDGLLIASPEYNSMMTPLLKNVIDWITRSDDDVLPGRVAAVVSASPGPFGGLRSQTLVRALLVHLGCHVVPVTCVLPQADKAFDAAGRLNAPRTQKSVQAIAEALVATARKLG